MLPLFDRVSTRVSLLTSPGQNSQRRLVDEHVHIDDIIAALLTYLVNKSRPLRTQDGSEALSVVALDSSQLEYETIFTVQVNEGIALKQIIDMEACAEWVQDQIQHPVKMTPAQVITVFVRAFPPSTPASDNVQALEVDGGSAYKLYIIIFSVVAVLMIPLCYLLYLRVRYRQNWLVFLQWRTTHSIPWIRWRYAPQRIRDQMRGKLQRKTDPLRTVQSSKSSFITSTTDSVTFVTQKMSDKQMLAAMYPSDVLVGGHRGNPSAAALENLSTKYWV